MTDRQPKGNSPLDMEVFFAEQQDPWGYKYHPEDIRRANIIEKTLSQYPISRLLDIGCAEGYITQFICSCADYTLGIDVSPTAIERAIYSYGKLCDFQIGDILTFRSETKFDAVTITGVLYYVTDEFDMVFSTLDNVLRSGGILLTSHIQESSEEDGYLDRFIKKGYHHERSFQFTYKRFVQSLNVFTMP